MDLTEIANPSHRVGPVDGQQRLHNPEESLDGDRADGYKVGLPQRASVVPREAT
ncbi:hypothetical protein QOZ89_32875 [Pseudofrankia sp. BMG5.37]|uniref:hypothetical protein n=1 Tax=Pseudofrankia sp. BMG5.36 TaxID=1834512 RepID=UPI0012FFA1CF|nr:hypothetical protein [Pseudofrankia sp. BMG5.36]MDT3444362.1 hypothetical protein [Pseudofrankia sp. BMG5.37]